jgi:hypothetical protein
MGAQVVRFNMGSTPGIGRWGAIYTKSFARPYEPIAGLAETVTDLAEIWKI